MQQRARDFHPLLPLANLITGCFTTD